MGVGGGGRRVGVKWGALYGVGVLVRGVKSFFWWGGELSRGEGKNSVVYWVREGRVALLVKGRIFFLTKFLWKSNDSNP